MRILHVIDHLGLGGAQRALPELLDAWPAPEDQLYVFGIGKKCHLLDRYRSLPHVSTEVLNHSRADFRAIGRVAAFASEEQIDILHAHLAKSTMIALLAKLPRRTRRVVHLRVEAALTHWLARGVLSFRRDRADAFIAVSRATAKDAHRRLGIPKRKLHVVYNCFAADRIRATTGIPVDEVRRRFDWPSTTTVFGSASRLSHEKGLPTLIAAFAKVRRAGHDVALLIVGDGPLRRKLEADVASRGIADRVGFAGFQSPCAPWIDQCDVAVLTSVTEGLPMSLVEASALGKPIVATDVGGVAELVEHGRSGLLVPAKDVNALAAGMEQMLGRRPDWERMGRHGAERVRAMFSPSANSRRLREIYQDVLAERGDVMSSGAAADRRLTRQGRVQ